MFDLRLKFPSGLCRTECQVYMEGAGLDENTGKPVGGPVYKGLCLYSDKAERSMGKKGLAAGSKGKILIEGDIGESDGILAGGKAVINPGTAGEAEFGIHAVSRPRNPDGTVNYTLLILDSL